MAISQRLFVLIGSAFLLSICVQAGQTASKEAKPAAAKEPVKNAQKIKISLADLEVSVYDNDAGKVSSSQKLANGGKLSAALDIGENQKLIVKFVVRNAADNQAVKSDQAFVRLTHPKADREVVLIAEQDGDAYKLELDIPKRAVDFHRLSGSYELRVDVGDVNFLNAISSHVGTVKLNFPNGVTELADPLARFAVKPEIKHTFREPEVRPPATVSSAFSLAVLAPFVLLALLWARLGVNLNNFDFHPASLVFYGALGGIFYLYYLFWVSLNMFTTLKYLTVLGTVAFFSGNAMFARQHRKRTGKEIKE